MSTEATVDTDFAVVLRPAVQDLGQRRVSFVTRTGPVPAAVTWLGESLAAVAAVRGTASAGNE